MEDFSSQATPVDAGPSAPKAPDFSAYASPVYDPHSLAQARVMGSMGSNPDQAAQSVKLAREVQLPTAAVETDPKWFRDQATTQQNSRIVSDNPVVARWLAANPDGASVANDDFENLSAIGKAAHFVVNAGRSIGAGVQSFNTGVWGTAAFGAEALGLDTVGGFLLDRARAAKNVENQIGPQDMARMGLIERGFNTGFNSVGSNLATLPIGFIGTGARVAAEGLTAAERVMLGMMGVTTGGQSYLTGREAGLNPWQAGAYGVADATAEVVGERFLGSVGFLRNIRAGSSFGKLLQYEMTKEVKGEVATTVWQNFNQWMEVNPDKPIGDWLAEQPAAIAETVIATLVGGGVMSGAVRGTQRIAQIAARDESKVDASAAASQSFAQLAQLSSASKVLQRDTETFESFVKTVTEDGGDSVYISPQALMQSGVAEAVAKASPEVAAQLPEAMQNGTDVRISTSEYLGRMTLDGTAQKIADDIKIEQGGFSTKEAQTYMAENGGRLKAEVEAVLTATKADDAAKASRQVVQDDILQKLNATQRFTNDVNTGYATLMANFFATQAHRLGVTPEAMYRQYEPRIVAEGAGALKQAPIDTPEFKRWFGESKVTDKSGSPLVVYHGTNQTFEAFDPLSFGFSMDSGKLGAAHYFTTDSRLAGSYATMARAKKLTDAQNIVPAYLSLKNPLEFDARDGKDLWAKLREQSNEWGIKDDPVIDEGNRPNPDWSEKFTRAAQDHGYDGVTLQFSNSKEIAVFDPKQIKSAIGNNGQFDPNNPSILRQENLGAFDPDTNTIALLKPANLSTFFHEGAHFYLEVLADLANRPDAPQAIKDDMASALKWMGIGQGTEIISADSALETWNLMTLEEKREYHEKFARGFEAYLFEGNAPNVEVQGLFRRFRSWMVDVYKSIKRLNADLDDEIRGVFDRLIATDEQIETAEAARDMGMMFSSEAEANKFGVDWLAYQSLNKDATDTAKEELGAKGLADLKWLSNAKDRTLKALQAEADSLRSEIRMQVTREEMATRVYRAWQFLTTKIGDESVPGVTAPNEQMRGKLRTEVLRDMYGTEPDALWRKLSERKMTSDANGLHPEIVAEMFGYSSADEMVRELSAYPSPREQIRQLTDERMLREHGELATQEGLERAVDEAVQNEARQRFVATQLAALEKSLDVKSPNGVNKKGHALSIAMLPRMARELASGFVAQTKIRELSATKYSTAQARAAKEAKQSFKKGDIQSASDAEKRVLINGYATKAAHQAIVEMQKDRLYLKKFDKQVKSIDAGYQDQIDAILESYDLKQASNRSLDRKESLKEWVAKQEEAGFSPDIPKDILEGLNRKNYREMTVEEMRGLVDTVKQIEHMGRLKKKLLTAKDQREFSAAVSEIADSIEANAQDRHAVTRSSNTKLGQSQEGLKKFWASHMKAAMWARIFDGDKDGGRFWEYVIRPANAAGDYEVTARAKATEDLSELIAPVLKQGKMHRAEVVEGVFKAGDDRSRKGSSFNREEKLAIALNLGNAGNIQRLLGGEHWTMQDVAKVTDSLTESDWKFVQSVWDYIETYRPLIAAKERRVYGREPNWVEPTPVITKFGTLKGGYYPIKYDPLASARAGELQDAEEAQQKLKGAYTSATTRRSFTKDRSNEVNDRPLMYSLDGLYSGLNEVIHDLAWHEFMIDANRLIKNEKISAEIRNRYGPEVHAQFKSWLEDIAVGNKAGAAGERALGWIRKGVSISGLGINVMSALVQPFGITQSFVRVGAKWVGRGVAKYIASPIDSTKEVNAKSEFMRNRSLTRLRELYEIKSKIQGQTKVREGFNTAAYYLMLKAQQMVDVPTWIGAYEKAISSEPMNEDRAIALADQAVIDAQGSGTTKDQAAIERGGEALKLFTVFYSFQNTAMNIGVMKTMTSQSKAKLAADYLMLYTAPVILITAMKAALTPGDSGDDDWKKISRKLIGEQIAFLAGLMFGVRELGGAMQALTGTQGYGTDYQGPAGVRLLADLGKLATQIHQGEADDALRKAVVNVGGELLRLPSAQMNRTITGFEAMKEGKTKNPAALVMGYQEPH